MSEDLRRSKGPTFVATFEDGEVTRMTVYQGRAELDVARGIRLAFHAYCSRKRTDKVPPIVAAQYIDGETGAVLREYTAEELTSPAQP